jgi:hypothetical protein
MDNDDPRIVKLIKDARADLSKFGEDRCLEAKSLFDEKSSTIYVAKKMGCSILEASSMLQASLRKQMDDSGIDQIIEEKRHLPNCPKSDCIDGKLAPLSGTQYFTCDTCESKFEMKLNVADG